MKDSKAWELFWSAAAAFPERTTVIPDPFASAKVETSQRVVLDFAQRVKTETMASMVADDMTLRLLLAFNYAGHKLYHDDGELQDNRMLPYIDFKRDPVPVIQQKMAERIKTAMTTVPEWRLEC